MDKKKVQAIDYFMGLLMGIIGVIFFIAFMGVDAYMFNIQPPPWSRTIENNIFLQPFWLDFLSTIMLVALIVVIFLKPSKKSRRSRK